VKFKQEDFKKMRYNPMEVPKGTSLLDHYPTLKLYKELDKKVVGFDADKILSYVIFLIDDNSPFFKVEDFAQRHRLAAQQAGLKETDIEKLDIKSNVALNSIFSGYLRVVNSDDFTLWFSLKQNFYNNTEMIRDATLEGNDPVMAVKRKQEIGIALKDSLNTIRDLEARLFKDERIKDRVTQSAMIEMVNWTERLADPSGTVH